MAIDVEEPTAAASVEDGPSVVLERRLSYVYATAELVDCTCPDHCERDHANE
jgi:hypothetical protein